MPIEALLILALLECMWSFNLLAMVILFDGVCNLCNGFVQFIIRHDRDKKFRFASLQSNYGKSLISYFNLPLTATGTVILYHDGKVSVESDASIEILSSLGGMWKFVRVFRIFPRFIRNGLYRLLARNRYRIFGKTDQCMVPSDNTKDRFLDDTTFRQ
jgi:predicted DCC family thiol-disulfide oxidoreductase YuxK